jgi:hypothetical protein
MTGQDSAGEDRNDMAVDLLGRASIGGVVCRQPLLFRQTVSVFGNSNVLPAPS